MQDFFQRDVLTKFVIFRVSSLNLSQAATTPRHYALTRFKQILVHFLSNSLLGSKKFTKFTILPPQPKVHSILIVSNELYKSYYTLSYTLFNLCNFVYFFLFNLNNHLSISNYREVCFQLQSLHLRSLSSFLH